MWTHDSAETPAQLSPQQTMRVDYAALVALVLGVALWATSFLGYDPTNIPQAQDFEQFHLPSAIVFAQRPLLDALSDYPAAPFPLFYLLAGWLYRLTGSAFAIRLWATCLGVLVLLVVARMARARFARSSSHTALLLAATLVSPYFRGQSAFANTDILALLFAFAALCVFGAEAPRLPSARGLLALTLACLAVYTRQFYVFLPAYLLLRIAAERTAREWLVAASVCALLAVPIVALVFHWGGLTPPRFRAHSSGPSLSSSIPAVLVMMSFYAVPWAALTLRHHRRALLADLRRPALLAASAALLILSGYLFLARDAGAGVIGGGIPLHLIGALPLGAAGRSAVLAGALWLGGTYLCYLVQQRPAQNSILVLIALSFFPTHILFQRYFDPLVPLASAFLLSTRESARPWTRSLLLWVVALELVVAAVGIVHYRRVFAAKGHEPTSATP